MLVFRVSFFINLKVASKNCARSTYLSLLTSPKNTCPGVFFNSVASLQPACFLKRDSNSVAFLWSFQNVFKNVYFEEHLQTSASWAVLSKSCSSKLYNIHRTKVASDKCSVKKSINMLTSCGCFLHENTCVGVSF